MLQKSDRWKRRETLEPSGLSLRALTRDELRALDQKAEDIGLSTLVLMENAGRGAARVLNWAMGEAGLFLNSGQRPKVLVVCGPGNNGGDGAVLARHLDASGMASVELAWISAKADLRGLAPAQQRILSQTGVHEIFLDSADALKPMVEEADWVVDGLFGTGLTRGISPESLAGLAIEIINGSGRPILALDIPSGLDADSGQAMGCCIRATITGSFVAMKVGFEIPEATQWTGRLELIDIGLPARILEKYAVK